MEPDRGRGILSPTETGRRFAHVVILTHTVSRATRGPQRHTLYRSSVCRSTGAFGNTQTPYAFVPLTPLWSPLFEAILWNVSLGQQRTVFTVISLNSLPQMGKGHAGFRDIGLSPQWKDRHFENMTTSAPHQHSRARPCAEGHKPSLLHAPSNSVR